MVSVKTARSSFRTVQLFFASMIGGIFGYFITKYYDTLETKYFTFMLIIVIPLLIIMFILHYFLPDEIQ